MHTLGRSGPLLSTAGRLKPLANRCTTVQHQFPLADRCIIDRSSTASSRGVGCHLLETTIGHRLYAITVADPEPHDRCSGAATNRWLTGTHHNM